METCTGAFRTCGKPACNSSSIVVGILGNPSSRPQTDGARDMMCCLRRFVSFLVFYLALVGRSKCHVALGCCCCECGCGGRGYCCS